MRTFSASAIAAAILLAALPTVPQRAEANTGVLRCKMADGTSVYTNKACSAFGAKATPLSAEVLNRIEREQRYEAKLTGVEPSPADALQTLQASVRRAPQSGCADSPQQLAADLAASVAMRDVNRVAESFDWAGMQHAQAQRVMMKLEGLATQVVGDAEYFDAAIGSQHMFADASAASDGAAGVMQVTFNSGNGRTVMDFDVQRDRGCYFLRY